MSREQLRKLLQELAFSADLPEPATAALAEVGNALDVRAGTALFREGSANQALYLICSGTVALEMFVPGRGSVRLLTLGAGDMVAWSAVLGRGEMTATAIVTCDSRLIAIPADKLVEICESNHDVGYRLMRRMAQALSRRLVATRLQLLDLYSLDPPAIKT